MSDYRYTLPDLTKPPDEPVSVDATEPVEDVWLTGEQLAWDEIREVTQCTGHCCRAFSIGLSPVELGQKVIKARELGKVDGVLSPEHVEWITTALVYLGEYERSPSGYDNITAPPVEPPWTREAGPKPRHWFTCRHLVDDRCAIYERRPPVCRRYPYRGNECHNVDCTRRTVMAAGLSWHWPHDQRAHELVKAVDDAMADHHHSERQEKDA